MSSPSSRPSPSNPLTEHSLSPGTVLSDRYRILRLLGAGSSGRVYAAEHVLLKKKLALKILHRELTNVPALVARFEREALASAHLEHPNIAAALDFGKLEDGSLFLALEYVEGRLLRDELAGGSLGVPRSLHIARQIASALVRAQELEIVHRDLKPENVMLLHKDEEPDFVKVLDFGIARVPMSGGLAAAAQPITRVGTVFGTPEYMAPEQALGQPADGRADLYALGVILFEMIAGVRPYEARDSAGILAQQIAAPPPTVSARAPKVQVTAPVEQLLQRLLQRDLSARFQKATEVLAVLDTLLARASVPAPALAPRSVPPPRLATFLPGDPLPAFDLPPEEGAAIARSPVSAAPAASKSVPPAKGPPKLVRPKPPAEPPDAPTVLRLPSSTPPSAGAASAEASSAAPHNVASGGAAASPPGVPSVAAPSAVMASESARGRHARAALSARAKDLGAVLNQRGRQAFGALLARAETLRSRLPAGTKKRLAGVSTPLLVLLAALLVAIVVVGAGVVSLLATRGGSGTAPAVSDAGSSPSVPTAPSAASSAPEVALVTPKEDGSLIALASAKASEGQEAEAVSLAARALTQHPSWREDARLAPVLFRGAASENKETSELAFGLLQGTMAARGAEIVYQLAGDKGVRESVRKRAEKWLRSPEFVEHASGALQSAVKLRYAESCSQKHDLLALAGKVGGRQTLDVLRDLQVTTGCGLSGQDDCYPCLRKDRQLAEAIARVQERLDK